MASQTIIKGPEDELPTESLFLDKTQLEAILIAISDSTLKCNQVLEPLTPSDIAEIAKSSGLPPDQVAQEVKAAQQLADYLLNKYAEVAEEIHETLSLLENPEKPKKTIITP